MMKLKVPLFRTNVDEVKTFLLKNKEFIGSIYGAPKNWPFDGGRPLKIRNQLIPDRPLDLIDWLNSNGFGFSLVCNTSLEEEFFEDVKRYDWVHSFLEKLNESDLNSVIVGTSWLSRWFKDNYSELDQVASIMIPIHEGKDINVLCDQYHQVVIPQRMDIIEHLDDFEQKEKLITFAGSILCPITKDDHLDYTSCRCHFRNFSVSALMPFISDSKKDYLMSEVKDNAKIIREKCPAKSDWNWDRKDFFNLLDEGISTFKIPGRVRSFDRVIDDINSTISLFIEYMVN